MDISLPSPSLFSTTTTATTATTTAANTPDSSSRRSHSHSHTASMDSSPSLLSSSSSVSLLEPSAKEFERVAKRQALVTERSLKAVDEMLLAVSTARQALLSTTTTTTTTTNEGEAGATDDVKGALVELQKTVAAQSDILTAEQKEFHASISKFGKVVDKVFKSDLAVVGPVAPVFEERRASVHRSIAQHFYRQGRFSLGEQFSKEANIETEESVNTKFVEIYLVIKAIREHNLGPPLRWATEHREELTKRGSSLEFVLHRRQFLNLLSDRNQTAALLYAKEYFAMFANTHINEIQRLMGSLIYINRLESSPYADLLTENAWFEIEQLFARESCSLLGFPSDSPYYLTITVGSMALPTLAKMNRVMQLQKTEWSQQDELPVEIDLNKTHRYHSVFVCPISKEQGTEANPPMMLPCGHVICLESLNRLTKSSGTRKNIRTKCPYCPSELQKNQAKRIYF